MPKRRIESAKIARLRAEGRIQRQSAIAFAEPIVDVTVSSQWTPEPGAPEMWCENHAAYFIEGDPEHETCDVFEKRDVHVGRSVSSDSPNIRVTLKPITSGLGGWDRAIANVQSGNLTLSGIFEGLWVQITGEPGVGKSTLIEKVCNRYAIQGARVLRHSGEESIAQIAVRMAKEGTTHPNIKLFFSQSWDELAQEIVSQRPQIVVIDSLNTLSAKVRDKHGRFVASAAGQEVAYRAINKAIADCCKEGRVGEAKLAFRPVFFVVRQINAKGEAAGQKSNDHAPDALLSLRHDGDKRRLDVGKTRFGGVGPAFFVFKNGRLTEWENQAADSGFEGLGDQGALACPVVREDRVQIALVEASTEPLREKERPSHRAIGFQNRSLESVLRCLGGDPKVAALAATSHIHVRASRIEGEIRDDGIELAVAIALLSVAYGVRLPSVGAFGAFRLNRNTESVSRSRQRQRALASGKVQTLVAPTSAELEDAPGVCRVGSAEALVSWVMLLGQQSLK